MSEENQVPDEPVEQQEPEVQEAPQISAVEQEAMNMGWKPQDQWDGNPDEWRDAKSFIDRGQLLAEIHKLKRRDREQYQSLQDMKKLLSGAERKGREAALAELKAQKVQALERGEYKRVADIDEQIAETSTAKTQETDSGDIPQDVYVEYAKEWMPQNPWFAADADIRDDFETVIRGYVAKEVQKNGTTPDPETAFQHATVKIKRMYPEKFKAAPRAAQNSVASQSRTTASKTGSTKSKVAWSDLSDDQRKIGARFIQQKLYASREEYIEDLRKSGELE